MAETTSRQLQGRRILSSAAVAGLVAACLVSTDPHPTLAATAKMPLSGIVDRNNTPASGWESVVNNYVVRVTWAQLQTTSGGDVAADNKIDQAVSAVRAWNSSHTPPEALKVRIDTGTGAPDWAKNLDGPNTAVAVHDASDPNVPDTTPETVGRFWEDAFRDAYNDFESKLARLYDGTPEIHDVTISRCTLSSVEPFLRTASSKNTINNLLAAGYTVAADHTCQTQQIDEAKAVWIQTPSSVALNPYQQINPDGTNSLDESFTESMIAYCRTTLGSLCVLANNSLRDPPQTGPHGEYTSMYNAIKAAGAPITFQTAGVTNVGSLCRTLTTAVSLGANSVEITGGYSSDPTITQAGLDAYDHALDRVQPPDGTAPSAPTSLKATINSSSSVSLTWQPATDAGYGVACHAVARNGTQVGDTMGTSFTDTGANTATPIQYTVSANDGAGNAGPAASASITPPITTVSASPSAVTFGSPVTLTATVTSQIGGTPTGSVKFFDGSNELPASAAMLSNGQTQFTTSSLPAGSHSITAAYQGDSTFPPSTSSAITATVNKAGSSTALTSTPNPSSYGSAVTLTATVTGPSGQPTGAVTFKDGSAVMGSPVGLSGGQAQLTTSSLAVGSHTVSATYGGDGNLNASSTTLRQTVGKAPTSTAVSSSANPQSYGSPVAITAKVTSGGATPTGSVTFRNAGRSVGTVALDGTGTAQFTTTLSKVTNSITAYYAGGANFLSSTSPVLTQSLTNAPSTVSMTSSRNPITAPNAVTLRAAVSSSLGAPTGTVEFFDGSTSLGTSPISAGKASLTPPQLAAGGHSITASYSGDASFAPGTSPYLFQLVYRSGAVSSRTTLANTPSSSASGQAVTLAATVTGSGGPPTGAVWYFDNGALVGQASVDPTTGRALLTTSALAPGRHRLTAGYSGDARFNPSISGARSQTVAAAAPAPSSLLAAPEQSQSQSTAAPTASSAAPPPPLPLVTLSPAPTAASAAPAPARPRHVPRHRRRHRPRRPRV